MKRQWIQTVIIAIVNLILWLIPSNVSYLVAQNRDVLLGRYGLTHLIWAIFVIPVSLIWLYLIWSNEKNVKKRQFQVITLVLSIIIPIIIVDSLMRLGYPDIEYTLTTDKTGFRNQTELNNFDTIALGDSFTEGSNVTDEDVCTVKLSQKSNLSVYNLGMAGTHPGIYEEILKQFGTNLSPKVALCMLYEGNDFRDSNYEREDSITHKISNYFKSSPLRIATQQLLIKKLGGAKTVNTVTPSSKESFLRTKGCKQTLIHLHQIKKICDDNHIHIVIVYAPDKSHVFMPLICENISSETLREFMALRIKNLPPADKINGEILNRLDMKEKIFSDFCQKESLEFVSLTDSLRHNISLGEQLYFTYDDHWTPLGREVVASTINEFVNELPEFRTKSQTKTDNPD